MSYGEILKRSWKNIWSGGSWGFLITWYIAVFAVIAIVGLVFVAVAGVSALSSVSGWPTESLPSDIVMAFLLVILIALALVMPLGVIYQGGIISLSNELAEGRKARLGLGWGGGIRHFGPLFLVALAVFFVGIGVFLLAALPFGLVFGLSASSLSGIEGGDIGSILMACGCGGLFYLVWIAFAVVLQSWSELSARHVVIGGMSAGVALSAAMKDVREDFKRTFFFALMLFGITMAVSLAFSFLSTPFDLASESDSQGLAFAGGLVSFALSLASMFVSAALVLLQASGWTLFFRSQTGIDGPAGYLPMTPGSYAAPAYAPPAPPAYEPPPAPPAYEPPPAPPAYAPPAPPAYEPPPAPPAYAPPAPPAYPPPAPPVPPESNAGFEQPIVDVEPPAPAAGPEVPPAEEPPPSDV